MTTNKFKVGDVVRLKSGGPSMTVQAVLPGMVVTGDELYCVWFGGGKKHEAAHFPADVLEPVDPKAAKTK